MSSHTTAAPAGALPPPQLLKSSKAWPVGMALVAVLLFAFYEYILPAAGPEVKQFVRAWLPAIAVNEAMLWVVFALGLNVVVGYAGLLDLGYVAFWAIGGYTAGWLMSSFFDQVRVSVFGQAPAGQERGVHLSFWFVLVVAGLFCAFWGLVIGAPTLRLKSDYLALVTLGFGEIIPQVFTNGENIGGFNLSNGTKGITPVDQVSTGPLHRVIPDLPERLGPFALGWKFLIFAAIAAFFIFVSLRLREGRLGRAWLAIREDELAASMMGVPLMRTKLAAYAVGAFAGGLGGVAYAVHVNAVIPDRFNFSISITLLAMVVLGGMGNVWGVTIGALVLAWINSTGLAQLGNSVNSAFGTNINFPAQNYLLFGAILVLMMLFRREGLIPEARTRQVLQEPGRTEAESLGADLEGEVVPITDVDPELVPDLADTAPPPLAPHPDTPSDGGPGDRAR